MNDPREEMISVMMDGELNRADTGTVIDELGRDGACRRRFERYQLISDTLRKQLPDLLKHDLTLRVNDAIARESAHNTNIRTFPEPLHSGWRISGFALAASLAAMAVIGVQWSAPDATFQPASLASSTPPSSLATVALPAADIVNPESVAAVAGVERGVQLVSSGDPTAAAGESMPSSVDTPTQWKVLRAPHQPRLAEYLVNHNEYSSVVSVRDGLMPQVRVVGYDPAR